MAPDCFVFFLLSLFVIARGQSEEDGTTERAERLAEMMKHDGVERVVQVTPKSFKGLVKKNDIIVMLFHAQQNDSLYKQEKYALEIVAKLFDKKGVVCTTSNMLRDMKLARELGISYPGVIKIFNHGRPTTYFGQRSPDVMVPYLSRMFEPPVTNIISKTGKKNFDNVQLPKVVAYVEKDSQEYTELVKTAMSFQPMIQFHAVFDTKIAKSLQLKKTNSLLFIKPFEKTLKLPSAVAWRENQLVNYLNQNKKQSIKKMLLENIHEIWSPDMKGYIIAVFAKIENPVGNRFFSLVKSLVRSVGDNEKLNFVWIDPDPFPAMKEYWQSTFNVDPTKPSIGAVDLNEQASTWLLPKEDKELKLSDLKKWCNNLLAGKLKLVPLKGKGKDRPESTNNENANTESKIQTGKDDSSRTQETDNQGTLSKDENKDEL